MRFVVLIAVMVLSTDTAHASCGPTPPWFSPAGGTVLPPDPTVLLFVPTSTYAPAPELAVQADRPITATTKLAEGPGFRVVAIQIAAQSGTVSVSYGERVWATYRIRADVPRHARVVGTHSELGGWGVCSGPHAIVLDIEGTAIGYRFRWHDGSPPTVVSADYPAVGHLGCVGPNLSREQLGRVREFDLIALFADGSERRLGTSWFLLYRDWMARLPQELLDPRDFPWRMLPRRRLPPLELPIAYRLRPLELDDDTPRRGALAVLGLVALVVLGRLTTPACRSRYG